MKQEGNLDKSKEGDPINKNVPIYKQIAKERTQTQPKRPQRI